MLKTCRIITILLFSFGLFACASAPMKGSFSVPHPVELEKRNVNQIITFGVLMPKALLVEKPAGSVAEWQIRGESSGKVIRGTAYFSGRDPLGNEVLTAQVENISIAELAVSSFVVLDQARRRCFSFVSGQWDNFDDKKFSQDAGYRKSTLAKLGSSLADIKLAWEAYCKIFWLPVEIIGSPEEVKVGSQKWQAYKQELERSMPEMYKLGSGEVRMGNTPIESFKREATQNPGLTWWQRFQKNLVINIPLVPLPPVLLIGLAESVVGASLGATISRDPNGYLWDAPVRRGDLASEMAEIKSADAIIAAEHWKVRMYLQYVIGTLLENKLVKKGDLDRVTKEVAEYLKHNYGK